MRWFEQLAKRLLLPVNLFAIAMVCSGSAFGQTLRWLPPNATDTSLQEYLRAFLPDSGVVSKWITPVKIRGFDMTPDEERVAIEFLDKFVKLTGHEIRPAQESEKANTVLVRVHNVISELLKEDGDIYAPFFSGKDQLVRFANTIGGNQKCVFYAARHARLFYVYGSFLVYRSDLTADEFSDCVYREFSQLTGLVRNSNSNIDSIFAGKRSSLSLLDEVAIHNLYTKELTVGFRVEP